MERAPAPLIQSEDVWNGIMHLPGDVALTTSNHHGQQLATLYTLWEDWIEARGDENDEPMFEAMLDASDCFQSSTFDALHGYYRWHCRIFEVPLNLLRSGRLGILRG